jgi:hypothetical protein
MLASESTTYIRRGRQETRRSTAVENCSYIIIQIMLILIFMEIINVFLICEQTPRIHFVNEVLRYLILKHAVYVKATVF